MQLLGAGSWAGVHLQGGAKGYGWAPVVPATVCVGFGCTRWPFITESTAIDSSWSLDRMQANYGMLERWMHICGHHFATRYAEPAFLPWGFQAFWPPLMQLYPTFQLCLCNLAFLPEPLGSWSFC